MARGGMARHLEHPLVWIVFRRPLPLLLAVPSPHRLVQSEVVLAPQVPVADEAGAVSTSIRLIVLDVVVVGLSEDDMERKRLDVGND
jgi:hypothetical protein